MSISLGRRIPGTLNLAAAVVVLVVIVSLALRAQSASPPAIAEFAPQAQQIKSAPQEQTSKFGNGQNGSGSGDFLPSPSPSPPPPAGLPPGAIVNHCIGDPPRQIEDPQSPPCVPYWAGNNGGNTSKGVSQNQVLVISTQGGADPTTGLSTMVDFVNKRFEFYGRKLVMKDDSGDPNKGDPAGQRAEADLEAAQQPFAAMNNNSGGGISYADQLAHDGVIATFVRPYLPETYLAAHAPYIYSYPMASDTLERTFALWGCARIKGVPATHAGLPLQNQPRKYAVLFTTESADIPVSDQPLLDGLANCGIQVAYHSKLYDGTTSQAQIQGNFESAIVNMKTQGVTSIFCLCERQDLGYLGQYADNQQYFPEWMISSYVLNDDNAELRQLDPSQTQKAHTFGISVFPMNREIQDRPSTWADPGLPYSSDTDEVGRDYEYRNLLLIAAGIQMAGPHLTPQAFQDGLQRAAFPNPDTGIAAGHVGFSGGSHAMTVDAAEFWWSDTAAGPLPDEKTGGTWCYVDHGARHSLANPWPRGDPFFTSTCDSGNEPATD